MNETQKNEANPVLHKVTALCHILLNYFLSFKTEFEEWQWQ